MKNVYISRIYFILAYVSLQVKCETFTLDLAKDADASMWKIKGFQEYLEDGSNLRGQLAHFFPAKFPFANFDLAQGVWVIVPSIIDCPPAPEMDSSESIESNENTELVSKAFFKWLGGTLPDDRSKNETSSTTSSTTIPTTVSTTTTKAPTKRTTTEKPLCYGNSSATFQFNLRAQLLTSIKLKYSLGGNALIKVYTPGVEPFEIYGNRGHQPDNWIEEKVPLSGRSVRKNLDFCLKSLNLHQIIYKTHN